MLNVKENVSIVINNQINNLIFSPRRRERKHLFVMTIIDFLLLFAEIWMSLHLISICMSNFAVYYLPFVYVLFLQRPIEFKTKIWWQGQKQYWVRAFGNDVQRRGQGIETLPMLISFTFNTSSSSVHHFFVPMYKIDRQTDTKANLLPSYTKLHTNLELIFVCLGLCTF